LDYIKEKDAEKKNKYKKWHSMSQHLVLNMSLTNSNTPANDISASYLHIINSKIAGMADKELHN
jgi:hypothetical protein